MTTQQQDLGLFFEYFEGQWSALPNFDQLTPDKQGISHGFDLSQRDRHHEYAFRFTGYLWVKEAGDYEFFTASDDGSQLSIDGQLIVNNDGIHGVRERSGDVFLSAGFHAITVTYFERWANGILDVSYAGPNISQQAIAPELLRLSAPVIPTHVVQYEFNEGIANTSAPTTGTIDQVLLDGVQWSLDTLDDKGFSLHFDGSDAVTLPDANEINIGDRSTYSVSLWFKTDSSAQDRQVLYEQGNEAEGLNIYLEENRLYVGLWQESTNQRTWLSTDLHPAMHMDGMHMDGMEMNHTNHDSASPWHNVVISLEATQADSSQGFQAFLNGSAFAGAESGGAAFALSDHAPASIGAVQDGTQFHDGIFSGDGQGFSGVIDNLELFETAISETEAFLLHQEAIPCKCSCES